MLATIRPDDIDLNLLNRLNAEDSFAQFTRHAWSQLEPRTPMHWSWHLDLLCEWLEEVAAGRQTRLIVNVPPRSMKSTLISIMFPCWLWATTKPATRFLCASYSAQLALKHSRDRRALLLSHWYQRNWHLRLAEDSNTQAEFTNANRGHMIASSVGASVSRQVTRFRAALYRHAIQERPAGAAPCCGCSACEIIFCT